MSQPPNDQTPMGYFGHLLSNPQNYASSPNQSSPSTPGSQHSGSSSTPFPPFGTQMSPADQAYHSQLGYHQNQQYGFQAYPGQPQFVQHHYPRPPNLPTQSSQPQFKVPQAQLPREPQRKKKQKGKQSVVNLDDESGETEEIQERRNQTRWTDQEEVLLTTIWIENSQDAIAGRDQREEIYWGKIYEQFNAQSTGPKRSKNMLTGKWNRMHADCQKFNAAFKQASRRSGQNEADYIESAKSIFLDRVCRKFQLIHVWQVLRNYPKWDAEEPVDATNLESVFGPDTRERPAGSKREKKKQKSGDGTTSGSTGGSQNSASAVCAKEYKRKVDITAQVAQAKIEKENAIRRVEEMKFLAIDTSTMHGRKKAWMEAQQAAIMNRYPVAGLPDEDDEDDD